MNAITIKPTYKVVKAYYDEINQLGTLSLFSEGCVSPAFATLLRYCAKQLDWTLAEQFSMKPRGKPIRVDGVILDNFKLVHGIWEAKDSDDDLEVEVEKKFKSGYPKDNILFQAPGHAIIWQNEREVINENISKPEYLVDALKIFFEYHPPEFKQWEEAVAEFKYKVPELGEALLELIEKELKYNKRFIQAFENFTEICRTSINPNLSTHAVEEMLIQHLLTERLIRKVFDYSDFAKRNIIANEIEKVILSLTSQYFSRHEFLKKLDRFYGAIETTATTINDYSQKQAFLNTIYEKFFQGFSVKIADTHGIVYTPQPIVNFMVKSVEYILQEEFNCNLSNKEIHILDPFVGTGNFIIRIMREIKKTALPFKYATELHCNEVLLLPYYISSMNIEHDYFERTGKYMPFEGICLVDTFELAEEKQISLFTEENTQRVNKQKTTPIFVIISNPPYNVGQVNENDNNKNRKYSYMDKRVHDTYSESSKASNKNALYDVYVKAYRWASDRIEQNGEGIVALISNNSFIEGIAFDGMRKHLNQDFNKIYILDLGGNVRKNPKLSGTTHNVFGIQVGVSINFFIKKKESKASKVKIHYRRLDEFWKKEQKYDFLDEMSSYKGIKWEVIKPDKNHNWLTQNLHEEFETFFPIGLKRAKVGKTEDVIMKNYGRGIATCRDAWTYNFRKDSLSENIKRMIDTYNEQVFRWSRLKKKMEVDEFVLDDDTRISWSEGLKNYLRRQTTIDYDKDKSRLSLYRPFTKKFLYYDKYLNERRYQMPYILPTPKTEIENKVICIRAIGCKKDFHCLMTNLISDLHLTGDSQCFPFYLYDEDGNKRWENITDFALKKFIGHYADKSISKWDIFFYVYGILHHPRYKEKYSYDLKRLLPHIPFAPDFWAFAKSGNELANLHVNYERQEEFPLNMIENEESSLDWLVTKMKLSKDRTQIIYNEFITLTGIPPETYEYRLGIRSALEWILDQYCIRRDKRSGIINDPNRVDDPKYILKLIKKVITVSLKTMEIVKTLPKYHT